MDGSSLQPLVPWQQDHLTNKFASLSLLTYSILYMSPSFIPQLLHTKLNHTKSLKTFYKTSHSLTQTGTLVSLFHIN